LLGISGGGWFACGLKRPGGIADCGRGVGGAGCAVALKATNVDRINPLIVNFIFK
jgi:hypothetical protein